MKNVYEFVLFFAVDNRVQWSLEDEKSLSNRFMSKFSKKEMSELKEFLSEAEIGNFCNLPDGTVVLKIKAMPTSF